MLLLLSLACSSSCSRGPAPTETLAPAMVLVTLDTTRADRLGSYGHAEARTPWLDALAARGQRYERAYSPLPLTIPSHASMFTGLYPFEHGIRNNGDAVMSPDLDTLAEQLQAGGWQTGASVAAFVTTRAWGFDQGFDAFFDRLDDGRAEGKGWHQERPAAAVVDDAIAWLDTVKSSEPVFLWVHVYDAHFPYAAPAPFSEDSTPYDAELAYVDSQLARLDAALAERGIADPWWIVAGDHGEGLGDKRELTHGVFVYESTQQVPLIVAGPGIAPAVVAHPVSLVDLTPTALSLAGRPIPGGLSGQVLPGEARPVYMEAYSLVERFGYAPHVAVVDGEHKLIDKAKPELYALPNERENLAEQQPEELARMRALLAAFDAKPPSRKTSTLDAETLARLEALGYLAGGDMDVDFDSLPDPADKLDVIGKMLRAEMKLSTDDREGAILLLEEVLQEDPAQVAPYNRLARLYEESGQMEQALSVAEAGLKQHPDNATVLRHAATVFGRSGDHARALALAEACLVQVSDDATCADLKLSALGNLGRPADAEAFALRFVQDHPEAKGIAGKLGILYFDSMRPELAMPYLRDGAAAEHPARGLHERMAVAADAGGQTDEALKLLDRELALFPKSLSARKLRLYLLEKKGDEAGQLALLDELVADEPKEPVFALKRATCLFDLGRVDEALVEVQRGLALAPEDPDMTLMYANVLKRQGKEAEALEAKARAEELHARRQATP